LTVADAVTDEGAREAAVEVATRWHYARYAIPERVDPASLLHWLSDFLAWMARLYLESPALWLLLVVGLLALSLALLGHVIWTVRLAMRANEAAQPPPRSKETARLDETAEAFARAGHFLDAAHAMHLACVERLVAGGVVELRRHDPNPTLRARLARAALSDADRDEFLRLLAWLERRWFRDRVPEPRDAELFAAWRALHARLPAVSA